MPLVVGRQAYHKRIGISKPFTIRPKFVGVPINEKLTSEVAKQPGGRKVNTLWQHRREYHVPFILAGTTVQMDGLGLCSRFRPDFSLQRIGWRVSDHSDRSIVGNRRPATVREASPGAYAGGA